MTTRVPILRQLARQGLQTALLVAAIVMLGIAASSPAVAQGATLPVSSVQLVGTFFTEGWGGRPFAKETVVDGIFLPRNQQWDSGTVWWDEHDGVQRSIVLRFDGMHSVSSLILQADNNDDYEVAYWDAASAVWRHAWTAHAIGSWGVQTRPDPTDDTVRHTLPTPVTTDRLRITASAGDRLYSVSEVQAYGEAAEPCAAPRPDEVVIYEDAKYHGRCVVKGIGRYDSAAAFAPLPDDSASSIRVGENATAVLASDNKMDGDNERFLSDDPDLGDNGRERIIGDNRMSSFEVQRKDCGASEAGVLACFVATRDRHGIAEYLAKRSIAAINDEVAALDPSTRERLADVVLDYPAFTLPTQRRRGRLLAAMGEAFSKHQLGFLAEVWSYTPIETRPGGGGEFYPDSGKVVVGHDVDDKVLRNTLVHETFHAFNQHEDGPPDSLNEGSAIWVFKEAFGSQGVAQNWAEATYGTKLYYRGQGNPDYRLEVPANPTQKLVDEFRYLSSKDESRLPWHSQDKLTYCYQEYWERLDWGQPTWDEYLANAETATQKMLSDSYCALDDVA